MKIGVYELEEAGVIHRAVPIIVVGIAALLAFVIPFKIITNLEYYYLTQNPLIEFQSFIFLGLLITSILGVSLVRQLEDSLLKSFLYLVTGFTTFWVVGAVYHSAFVQLILSEPVDTPYYEIFSKNTIPVTIFAIANAATVLVGLIDGKKNGMLFGSMGIGVVIFSVIFTKMAYINSVFVILLILAILWALIPILWIKILADYIDYKAPLMKRVCMVLNGALFTMPFYLVIGLLTSFLLSGKIDLKIVSFSAGLFYFLTNVILVVSIFGIYDLALRTLNYKKKITSDRSVVYIELEKKKKPSAQLDFDPFEDLIEEMKQFKKEFGKGKFNRFASTQKIGALREKFDLIYAKHTKGSKDIALKLLRQIEKESEFAYN